MTRDAGIGIDRCSGSSVGASTVAALEEGGPVDPNMKWLYPYDATVFPQGIAAPVLQWSAQAGGADAVYVHLKSQLFEFKGCFGKTNPTQLPLPDVAWNSALYQSNGASDPLVVELTTMANGTVSGPITETWTFALGTLKGLVYYDTYDSPQVGNGGAVMMIKPGNAMPTPVLAINGTSPSGPCISCHSLSSDGSMLVVQQQSYPGGLNSPSSQSFDLETMGSPNATMPAALASDAVDAWGFSAVYPDGSRLLTCGEPQSSSVAAAGFVIGNGDNPGTIGPVAAGMFNPFDGGPIASSGLAVPHAMMPMFSPDGKRIVFNDYDDYEGHSLMVQDFDAATNTFSNPVVIYNDPANYPGWPAFLPDSSAVVFAMGPSPNFSTIPPASFTSTGPQQVSASDVASSKLYVVDLSTPGTATPLSEANGYNANEQLYLPYGSRDQDLNFYPTVSPVAAGGYFWLFFTSRRQYGNVMVDTSDDAAVPDPVFHSETRKIWVSAIDIGAVGDPSHPAFYLPGQEAPSGSFRTFTALAPCLADGGACDNGIECCGGYCTNGRCGERPSCSPQDDKCTTDSDCCMGTNLHCIAGTCEHRVD